MSCVSLVVVSGLSVSETTPFAGDWGVLVSLVELDVLHWVTESKLVNSCASYDVSADLNNWQIIDQLFGIGLVSIL